MSRRRVVLGNKPDWIAAMLPRLRDNFDISADQFNASHASWADIVVPLHLDDYPILRGTPLFQEMAIFPNPEAVAICNNKKLFRQWFRGYFNSAYLPSDAGASPLSIAKPCVGTWGKGAMLVDTSDQNKLQELKLDQDMATEEYITGPVEFAQHILFDNGRVKFSALTTYDYGFDTYVAGADCRPKRMSIATTDSVPDIFVQVLRALNYSGTACFDYKIDATGQIKIFEMNPRMGGSLISLANSYVSAYADYLETLPRKFFPANN